MDRSAGSSSGAIDVRHHVGADTPRPAERFRQARTTGSGARAGRPGRGTALHRRQCARAARSRPAGARSARNHRLSRDHGRPHQNAASAHSRRPARTARHRRCRDGRARHRADRPAGGQPVSLRTDRGAARLRPGRSHREHRHRRSGHAARRGQEPCPRGGAGRSRRLRAVDRGAARRGRHHAGAAPAAGGQGLRAHRALRRSDRRLAGRAGRARPRRAVRAYPAPGAAPRVQPALWRESAPGRRAVSGGRRRIRRGRYRARAGRQGTLVQQPRRCRRRAGMRQGVPAHVGLRDRQAR